MTRPAKIDRLSRQAKAKSAKRSRRKEELADAALVTLRQLGYARTSLRDIAEQSDVSVGTLHYYFEDKADLIAFCVRRYKTGFVEDLDAILRRDETPQVLAEQLSKRLGLAIQREAEAHRLWYDIRTQSMFDPAFAEAVAEIEAALIAVTERLVTRLGRPADEGLATYLLLDSAFRYYLQRCLAGDGQAVAQFCAHVLAQLQPQGAMEPLPG
ncbi:TetR/AcrR family transcriptional regulator [Chachezhania sediminis]|uniref:TetR/AcrR family transcriptional regulator n=1 Tax=Chachezhania sediminis TaxID=2599291 RepID=UPI00131BFD4D|nr:TetR/AcrR family transcriptional regulator [Chachezhania sediminis]